MRNMQDVIAKAQQYDDYWIEAALYDFTETVCQLMEEADMSRSELAQKLDVSPAYITKLLRGDANVTIKTMVRLARVFGREVQIALPAQAAGQGRVSATVLPNSAGTWPFRLPKQEPREDLYTPMSSASQKVNVSEKESIAA